MNGNNPLADFWGLNKEYEHLKGKIIFPPPRASVRLNNQLISISEHPSDILPQWAKDEVNTIFINKIYEYFSSGEPLLQGIDAFGRKISLIQRDEKNRIIFNFNPQEAINFLLEEKYLKKIRPFYTRLPYGFPKIIPSYLKKRIKSIIRYSNKKANISFPDWPIEKSVELIRAIFLECMQMQKVNTDKVKNRFWPESKKFAIVLTHDVDTAKGFKNIDIIAAMEEEKGFVSTWFMPAKGYNKDRAILNRLLDRGHEIAMHGDYHDNGLSFLSKDKMSARFKNCFDFIERYDVKGFRAPSLFHSPILMNVLSELGFYDSSMPDTGKLSPFPHTVGCCSVFPFIVNNVLEIPISLPLDSSLIFLKFNSEDIVNIWKKKTQWLKQIGGLLLLDTHPEPHFIADSQYLQSYKLFLDELSVYNDAWKTTAGSVADWWTRRMGN